MPESMGAGGGFIDFNADGLQDILLVAGGSRRSDADEFGPGVRLFRQQDDGTFAEATRQAGLDHVRAYGFGVTVADYDNDGDEDFLLTTLHRNLLFRNDAGNFTEVGVPSGLTAEEWSTCGVFFDANRDGRLDLYVCNYVEWSPETDLFCTFDGTAKEYCTPQQYTGVPGRLYMADGDGLFLERTAESGMADVPGKSLGAVEVDYNQDGWPDLVVANDTERNLLFENDGDGTFTERGVAAGIAFDESGRPRAGMGIDAGVTDSTMEVSIFVGNFSREMIGVFRHSGSGLFEDRAATSRIGRPSLLMLTFGLILFDADLDGDLDLFAANGHVQPLIAAALDDVGYAQKSQLFLNDGTGTFTEVPPEGVLATEMVGRGAAYADLDSDGDLDVLITENNGPAHVWRNRINEHGRAGRRYLRVRLRGVATNRDGIGSVVTVETASRSMQRRVRSGASYTSASERIVTFGLASHEVAERVVVEWGSGLVDTLADVQANHELEIREGRSGLAAARPESRGERAF